MDKIVSKITVVLYLALAIFPLLKANLNSGIIIFCSVFAIYDFVKNKKKVVFNFKIIVTTLMFWIFLFHEMITLEFNFSTILFHLPFLVLPLLFIFKPDYINKKTKKYSLLIFQSSVIIQIIIYLIVFLRKHSLSQIFNINNYNIPLFRTYVFENTQIDIHPTYFSAFLLSSFTISLFQGVKSKKKECLIFHLINILFTSFFIFVFISKIIIVLLTITIFVFIIIEFKKKKKFIRTFSLIIILGGLSFFGFQNLLKKRFNEIRTEINRPLVGDYHNSINIRIAIIKCSLDLLKDLPFLGYGNNLQNELNNCYKKNNNSNFYLLAIYNTHNYYINLILYGGYFFFLIFVYYIFNLLFRQNYPLFIVIFILQILLINLTENFFSRQHGLVLFIYFISLFLIPNNKLRSY